MQISKDAMILTGYDANALFGDPAVIDGDASLSAFLRAIVLKSGAYSVNNLGELTKVSLVRVRRDQELEIALDFESSISLVECFGCFDAEIDSGEDWISEFTFNGKSFPVNQYLSQFARTKIYVNEKKRRVVAYVQSRVTNIWIQAFESVLCRLMPWYFPHDLSDDDKKFYKTISADNKSVSTDDAVKAFVSYVDSIAESFNLKDLILHKQLDGVADRMRQSIMANLRSELSRLTENINEYRSRIADLYEDYDRAVIELNGLETTPPAKDDAMFQFFKKHKQVSIITSGTNALKFGVNDTLVFYDEDEFKRIFNNGDSYLGTYNYSNEVLSALWGIFGEHRGIIRTQAVFNLRSFKLVEPIRHMTFVKDSMPNPHIFYHACSGGNEVYYEQYAESGDWDLAIEQAISATKNLNWGDSTVCREMIGWLIDNSEVKCIYVNDGSLMDEVNESSRLVSFDEFVELIKKIQGDSTENG